MTPPPQQSGVSGDGRDALWEQLLAVLSSIEPGEVRVSYPDGSSRITNSYELAVDDLMRLLDAQYNAGLEAAEGVLPEKIDVKLAILASGPQSLGHGYAAGSNAAIGAARQQIRALRRGVE